MENKEIIHNKNMITREVKDVIVEDISEYAKATFERGFPNEKDGLKPSLRRILWTMWEYKVYHFTKVQKLAGLVLGYHPHGDASVSNTLVGVARDFIQNHTYIDRQGNFGTVTTKRASAPRYIEAKLSAFARDVITDAIDRISIDYVDNYDNTRKEPSYLPTKIPLALINGSIGMGQAFAVDIPPHNLIEIANRCILYIRNKRITADQIWNGLYPDYPVGGIIINGAELETMYTKSERGIIKVRGDIELDQKNNRIIINSLPHNNDFDSFTLRVQELMSEKDKSGNLKHMIFSNVRQSGDDEKFKNGPAYAFVDCKPGTNLLELVETLYKKTNLEEAKSFKIMLDYGSKIRDSTLLNVIQSWYKINYSIRRKKITYEIGVTQKQAHIWEGVIQIYHQMDEVIELIKKSTVSEDETVLKMQKKFKLTPIQAREIYRMQLGSLTRKSEQRLKDNIISLKEKINILIENLERVDIMMIEDLQSLIKKYGRPRRTKVIQKLSEAKEIVMSSGSVMVSHSGYGVFDIDNIVSGQKVTNGIKSVKIDGKWTKGIINQHPITDIINGIILFHNDGTAQIVKPQLLNNWINTPNGDSFVTCAAPMYKEPGTLVLINDNGKIRRMDPLALSNRSINVGVIENCLFIPRSIESTGLILLMDVDTNYHLLKITDIPELGRNASGVNSGFDNGNVKLLLIDPKKNNTIVGLFDDIEDHDGYIMTYDPEILTQTKRVNKPQKIMKTDKYKISGIGCIDMDQKDTVAIFISDRSTFSLHSRNFRKLTNLRKINHPAIGLITISN